jgi:hypothetical protein
MVNYRMTRDEATAVAKSTEDAYSYDRYINWEACALVLRRCGYNVREAEAILRSKHMRWCGDGSDKPYGCTTSRDLIRYIQKCPSWPAEVRELVRNTFPCEEAREEIKYSVDGHEFENEESNLAGDGQFPPFRIFDINAQDYLPGIYASRADAELICGMLNGEE